MQYATFNVQYCIPQCSAEPNLGKAAESALLLMRRPTREGGRGGVAPFRGLIRKDNHEDCDDD